ncbi:MAG: outer membrane beta-barrel protein [Terracidiphilus sp.]
MHLRRSIVASFFFFFAAGALSARAQAVPSAYAQRFTVNVGALGSVFQPDYSGAGVAHTGPLRLYGDGAYMDLKLTRYAQIEAEARWLRFNSYINIREDNYLIGPRLPFEKLRFKWATPYAKVLIGISKMNFEYNGAYGHYTDIAFGGGVDVKLTRRLTIRAFDIEYQKWLGWPDIPGIPNSTLSPYGGSVGVSYKVN